MVCLKIIFAFVCRFRNPELIRHNKGIAILEVNFQVNFQVLIVGFEPFSNPSNRWDLARENYLITY